VGAVDLGDESPHVLRVPAELRGAVAGHGRHLHEDGPGRVEQPSTQRLGEPFESQVDALRVVEPVHPEDQHARIPGFVAAETRRPLRQPAGVSGGGVETTERDRYGEGQHPRRRGGAGATEAGPHPA